jgi:integrase
MLTDASIRSAIRAGGNKILTDGGKRGSGRLTISLRDGIRPEWYAVKWTDGKRRTLKLGTFPDMSLAQARERFKDGVSFDKPQKRGTLGELIAVYCDGLDAKGKRSSDEIRRTLERMADVIGSDKPANEVNTDDIVEMIRPVYARGKASMADHMRGAIHAAFGWVIRSQNDYRTHSELKDRFGITSNPATGIPTEPKVTGERWLSFDELVAFWKWLHQGGRNANRNTDPRNLVALQVLILTGQRVEEVLRIHSNMVNRHMSVIEWDTTKVDNRPHVIPASAQVLRRLTWIRRTGSGLYFPKLGNELDPTDDSTLRAICKAFVRDAQIEPFTTRDIRRTWKTLAGLAGVSKTDRDRVQNHSSGDVSSRHYDRYDYLPEKRAALERWESWFLPRNR